MFDFKNQEEYEQFLKDNILTTQQAGDLLGVKRGRMSQLVLSGELKPFYEQKNVRLFSKKELERYIDERDGK